MARVKASDLILGRVPVRVPQERLVAQLHGQQGEVVLRTIRPLGQGGFGEVHEVKASNCPSMALKMPISPRSNSSIKQDARMMRKVCSPFIMRPLGTATRIQHASGKVIKTEGLLMPLYLEGDMSKQTVKDNDQGCVMRFVTQMGFALKELKSKDIVHCDIKPSNILMVDDSRVVLTDFGLAVHGSSNPHWKVGTRRYMAPEVVAELPYTFSADMWSTGLSAIQMLADSCDADLTETSDLVREGRFSEINFPLDMWPEFKDLLLKMVCFKPDDRISPDELLQEPCLRDALVNEIKQHPELAKEVPWMFRVKGVKRCASAASPEQTEADHDGQVSKRFRAVLSVRTGLKGFTRAAAARAPGRAQGGLDLALESMPGAFRVKGVKRRAEADQLTMGKRGRVEQPVQAGHSGWARVAAAAGFTPGRVAPSPEAAKCRKLRRARLAASPSVICIDHAALSGSGNVQSPYRQSPPSISVIIID